MREKVAMTAKSDDASGPSPLWPIMEKFVSDEFGKLDRAQITPWAFLKAGPPMRVRDFYGHEISYQGIGFEGSPRTVFWSRYIEPFLEDIAYRGVDLTLQLSQQKGMDPQKSLVETQGLLGGLSRKAFNRMAEIDQRLRGNGFVADLALRNIDREQQAMEQFIGARINAELAIARGTPRSQWRAMNDWFREHPLVGWSVTVTLGIAGLLSKLLGAW
jgi:hypothetical protein